MFGCRLLSTTFFVTFLLIAANAEIFHKDNENIWDVVLSPARSLKRIIQLSEELRTAKEDLASTRETVEQLKETVESLKQELDCLKQNGTKPWSSSSKILKELINPTNPVHIPVKGFRNGQRLNMVFVPTYNTTGRFEVNFRKGCQYYMHFNGRFDETAIVRNSALQCSGGYTYWDLSTEEKHHEFKEYPFKQCQTYTLDFFSRSGVIEIFLDGKLLCTYVERYPGREIERIEIAEDLIIRSVRLYAS